MIELSPFRYCSHNWDMLPLKCSEDPSSVKAAPGQSESTSTMIMATLNDTAWKMDRTNNPLIISTGTFFCSWTQFTSSVFLAPGVQDAMSHTSLALLASLLLLIASSVSAPMLLFTLLHWAQRNRPTILYWLAAPSCVLYICPASPQCLCPPPVGKFSLPMLYASNSLFPGCCLSLSQTGGSIVIMVIY